MSNIHKNDIGTVFKCRIIDDESENAINISAATVKKIRFRKPTGIVLDKVAAFTTDGSDGYIEYATIDGDLDIVGTWEYQGYIVDSGYTNSSEIKEFEVEKVISPDA